MFIVDAQVHVWAANTPERPWPVYPGNTEPNKPHYPEPLTPDKLVTWMDANGIARVYLVPPSWEGERNDVVLAGAQKHPDRFRAIGRLDVDAPDARQQVERWMEQPGMAAMQLTFHKPYFVALLEEGRADWLWPIAERKGIPINVYLQQRHLHLLDRVAERHPGLRFLVNHCAMTGTKKDADAFEEFPKLLALAKRPNVAVKASCLQFYVTEQYPFPSLVPYVRQLYDAFGPKRMFWGTDLTRLPCTWSQALRFFLEEIPFLSAQDKEWIMGRAITEWQGWPAVAKDKP
ncbi:amidohydrolase [Ramlibacter sp. G-1-2-2]|uniref:Amidohydrolase n=1 Tax=Ramlibacter agri TaxID=2728837 RepID=A0A848HIN3_9BURK|nr:amidohydrolase family protein [Ramlibacter agri]NML47578.1 amidohydrolase [Ramlibacter agri]